MKIKPHKPSKPLIAALLIAILAVGYFTYAYSASTWPFQKDSTSEEHETNPRVSDVNNTPEASVEFPESPNNTEDEDVRSSKSLSPANIEDSSAKPTKPEIARITKTGSTIEIVATFNTTVNGTCKLKLSTKGQQDIRKEAPITIGPSYYICGFNVENVQGADWMATVTHVHNGKESDPVSQKIN